MTEYKITSYTEQSLDNTTLLPKGKKKTRYAVYKKNFPFPNKSIFLWETVKDGFKTEKEAVEFMKKKGSKEDESSKNNRKTRSCETRKRRRL